MRHRWRTTPAVVRVGIAPERAASLPGATRPDKPIRREDVPSRGRYPTPEPFDITSVVAIPNGTVSSVITLIAPLGTVGATVPQGRPVPAGRRGIVTMISPYIESSGGGIAPPGRVPGVTVIWQLQINGVPAGDYGAITTILSTWDAWPSPTPLLELKQGDALSAVVTYTETTILKIPTYAFVGIRVRGQFLAWTTDASVAVGRDVRTGVDE